MGATPLEEALLELVRKTCRTPRRLVPADLDRLRAFVGDGALDYVLVICAFHFINRIADILDVDPEGLPKGLRRFETLRRISVAVAARIMRRLDLDNRCYGKTFDEAIGDAVHLAPGLEAAELGECLRPLAARPKFVEGLALTVADRDCSTLSREHLVRVHAVVEQALPAIEEEADGFHLRPADPIEALVFVGTRYASRTTDAMVDAVRAGGFGDLEILDLAVAIASANQWARLYRLLDLPADLYYLEPTAVVGAAVAE